jgi:hypothetical protein
VTGRLGRRRRKLLYDLKERRILKLKEEALDCTMCRARFGRGFGPSVRQTAKWMNVKPLFNASWTQREPVLSGRMNECLKV